MSHPLLTAEFQPVLLAPETWRVVSSACPAELPRLPAPEHRAWMAAHAHAHPHREMLLVLRGHGEMGLNGEAYPVQPGAVFVVGAGEVHDLEWPPWAPEADHLWTGFMGEYVFARLVAVRQGRPHQTAELTEVLAPTELGSSSTCLPLTGEAERYPVAWRRLQIINSLATIVGLLLRRAYEAAEPDRESFQGRVIRTVQEHIRQTAGREASLDSLSRLAGYSKYHFLRLFRVHAGMTVHQFVDECRWARVQELRAAGCRQAEIADRLGFSCPSAFSRWLRRQSGKA